MKGNDIAMLLLKIGSQTRTRRAAELLLKNSIKTSIRKVTDDDGCAEGVVVSGSDMARAKSVLADAGINIKSVSEVRLGK